MRATEVASAIFSHWPFYELILGQRVTGRKPFIVAPPDNAIDFLLMLNWRAGARGGGTGVFEPQTV
jgi:hypothetical protein